MSCRSVDIFLKVQFIIIFIIDKIFYFRMKLKDIPSTELASYVNAFLVTCINPRNFHGYDIIQEMRNRVEKENYTNPYVLLALCNAGETITESDKKKLTDTFWNTHRTFWTGKKIFS